MKTFKKKYIYYIAKSQTLVVVTQVLHNAYETSLRTLNHVIIYFWHVADTKYFYLVIGECILLSLFGQNRVRKWCELLLLEAL